MRKKLIALLILAVSLSAFANGFTVKFGKTPNPNVQKNDNEGVIYDSTGNLTLEVMGAMSDNMNIGGGIEFNNQLEKNGTKLDIGYTPVYVNIQRRYGDSDANVFPYTIGRIGFALPVDYDENDNVESEMGFHLGIGIGLEFNHFVFEMVGTHNGFNVTGSSLIGERVSVNKLTFSFGYRFGSDYGSTGKTPVMRRHTATKKETTPVIIEEEKPTPTKTTTTEETKVNKEEKVYDELLNSESEDELSRKKYIESKILELDKLKEQGIITEEEYQAEKEIIINEY